MQPTGNFFYIFITTLLALLGFFSIRFYLMVDEVRKDVKNLLISKGSSDEKLINMKTEVDEIKVTLSEHGKQLTQLSVEISNLKQ